GQTERVNAIVEQYLRCYANTQQKDWIKYLSLAEFAYNSAEHSSTKTSPFYANYGFNPRMDLLKTPSADDLANDAATNFADALEAILKELKDQMGKAQDAYSRYANKFRINHPFKIGDYVYLKTKGISGSKLDTKFIGPYPIIKEISPVAFKLLLPIHMKIHPVFHVNLFKPAGTPRIIEPEPHQSIVIPQDRINRVPHSVINVKSPEEYPRKRWEWLVHWVDTDPIDDTWETASFFEENEELIINFYRGAGKNRAKPSNLEDLIYENLRPTKPLAYTQK
ncbi:hypothetical protein SeLEV6574_g08574, partial [Synchytrium endobioticum]